MRMFIYLFPIVGLCVRVGVRPLETAPVTPFIVEGGTGVIHVFTMQRAEVACLCSLLLRWHGQQSGLVLDVLEQCAGHT